MRTEEELKADELAEIMVLAAFAVAAMVGIVLGCWLADTLGFIF